jgi:TPR repeat protein
MELDRAARLHAEGLAMERRDDDEGAFKAFAEAANGGYAPSQRKLGELYDHGTPAVPRDYELSIRWYDRARDNGEDIPLPRSRMPGLDFGP